MKTKRYTPQPIDTSDIQLPEELNPLLEAMAKMCMRYGQKSVSPKDGHTARNVMTPKSITPASLPTKIFLKKKRFTIGILLWRL